jgi:nucleoside-diphosphate-sugar epimerase
MQQMNKVLITGANGFIGRALCLEFAIRHFEFLGAVRAPGYESRRGISVGEIDGNTDWSRPVGAVDSIVHLAARVHLTRDVAADPLREYRRVNVEGTLNLARQAARAGVRRFVFVSSIKVNGECTQPERPFVYNDIPAPADPYAISKYEAEQGLRELALESGMDVVIIRPVLVYGPGVKANFNAMMRWLSRGFPLPLGAIHNKRSFVGVQNLIDFIVTCLQHPAAANHTLLVSDGEDLSTTELLRRLARALGRPARLLPIPAGILMNGASLIGKRAVMQRLCNSLQVDITKTRELLGWSPPTTVDEGFRTAARGFVDGMAD